LDGSKLAAMKLILISLLFLSCSTTKHLTPAAYRISQVRLAPRGFIVWFERLDHRHYRFYKELPDSFQVGRVVYLGKK